MGCGRAGDKPEYGNGHKFYALHKTIPAEIIKQVVDGKTSDAQKQRQGIAFPDSVHPRVQIRETQEPYGGGEEKK